MIWCEHPGCTEPGEVSLRTQAGGHTIVLVLCPKHYRIRSEL